MFRLHEPQMCHLLYKIALYTALYSPAVALEYGVFKGREACAFLNGVNYQPGKHPSEKHQPAVLLFQHAGATHDSHLPQGINSSCVDPSLDAVVQEVHLSRVIKAPCTELSHMQEESKHRQSAVTDEKLPYS